MKAQPGPRVPFDEEGEWQLVALAVAHPNDAREICSRVGLDEFYRPVLASALDAALQLGDILGVERRVALVARAVPQLPRERLIAEVNGRVGPIDRWTRRVRTAARRRRVQALAAVIFNEAADAAASQLATIAGDLAAEAGTLASESPPAADPGPPALLRELRSARALGAYLSRSCVDR